MIFAMLPFAVPSRALTPLEQASSCVDTTFVGKGLLLAALYNVATSTDALRENLRDVPRYIPDRLAQLFIEENGCYVDYVQYRPVKVDLCRPECVDESLYWRDNAVKVSDVASLLNVSLEERAIFNQEAREEFNEAARAETACDADGDPCHEEFYRTHLVFKRLNLVREIERGLQLNGNIPKVSWMVEQFRRARTECRRELKECGRY